MKMSAQYKSTLGAVKPEIYSDSENDCQPRPVTLFASTSAELFLVKSEPHGNNIEVRINRDLHKCNASTSSSKTLHIKPELCDEQVEITLQNRIETSQMNSRSVDTSKGNHHDTDDDCDCDECLGELLIEGPQDEEDGESVYSDLESDQPIENNLDHDQNNFDELNQNSDDDDDQSSVFSVHTPDYVPPFFTESEESDSEDEKASEEPVDAVPINNFETIQKPSTPLLDASNNAEPETLPEMPYEFFDDIRRSIRLLGRDRVNYKLPELSDVELSDNDSVKSDSRKKPSSHNCTKCDKSFIKLKGLKIHTAKCKGDRNSPKNDFDGNSGKDEFISNNTEPDRKLDVSQNVDKFSDHDSFDTNTLSKKLHHSQSDSSKTATNLARPFRCSVKGCAKSFTQLYHLSVHKRKQEAEEKLFSCDQCHRSFSIKGSLASHKLLHTGEKRFKCDQCDKSFYTKGSLESHKLTHSKEKHFKCDQCHRSFSTKGNLGIHKLTHSGQKKHKCDECGRLFLQKIHLIVHQRMHSGLKPYSCEKCGKSFTQPSGLNVHAAKCVGEEVGRGRKKKRKRSKHTSKI